MLRSIVAASLRFRYLVVAFAASLMFFGVGQLQRWVVAQDFPGHLDIPMKRGPMQWRRAVLAEGVHG